MRQSAGIGLLIAFWLTPASAGAQAILEGLVTDSSSGQALAGVTVRVLGTDLVTRTGVQGRYRLTGLATGRVHLQAIRVGYAADTAEVSSAESQVVTVNFQLRPVPLLLDQIVVLANGQSSRARQDGASVARILPDSYSSAAIQSFADLITGRTSGLTVLHSGGSTGIGSRVRIRGSNSVALSNEPLYLLDGIRLDNTPTTFLFDTGDESPSRLDEIDQEFVEAIDVVKGPAAAALYGTAAANGVLQLQTRQGAAGPPRWTFFAEGGGITQPTTFPANYGLWTQSSDFPPPEGQVMVTSGLCTLVDVANGACVPDSLARYNPLMQSSPFRTGYRTKLGVTVGGGAPAFTYFVGGNTEYEAGVNPTNDLTRLSFRTNLSGHIGKFDVSLSSGFLHRDLGVPQNGLTYVGPIPNGMYGWPFRQSVDSRDHPTYGYDPIGPDQLRAVDYSQRSDHLTSAVTATWKLRPWLTLNGVTGIDDIQQLNRGIVPPQRVFAPGYEAGLHQEDQGHVRVVTANWSLASELPLSQAIGITLAGGTQYSWNRALEEVSSDAGGITSAAQQGAEQKTLGGFLSAQIGWRDRAFVTGALRADWNGGFPRSLPVVLYPAVMGSWIISDEGFFPRGTPVSSLRLRLAYGGSGLLPSPIDQLTLLKPVTVPIGGREVPTVTIDQLGNPNLRAEEVSEFETGFDAELARGRIVLQSTYYNKRSRNALVLVPIAGSIGSAAAQLQNVGVVSNQGVELMFGGDPIRSRRLDWNVSVAVTGNRNRLVSLGGAVSAVDLTPQQRLVPGFPLGGFWATPPDSVVDRNGDGMLGSDEVFFDPQRPKRYLGSPLPTRSVALMSSLDLRHRVRLWTQLDYEGGQRKFDYTEMLRCQSVVARCRPLSVASASLSEKANAALAYLNPDYRYGYIEDAAFLKWRELGLEWTVPEQWAQWAHARSMLLSLAVRNVATWTHYPGLDPEAARAQDNFNQVDYYTQPQVRYFVARLTMGL